MTTNLYTEAVFIILQFLNEQNFKDIAHRLEQKSGLFFNLQHFEEMVMNGAWEDVENYLSGFTKIGDNAFSTTMFFMIRKQKYFEALDQKDDKKAIEILMKELKVFSDGNENLFEELIQLLTSKELRDHEQLSTTYGDTKIARSAVLNELKNQINANPLLREKINFPSLQNSRLCTLINQSQHWHDVSAQGREEQGPNRH